MAVGLPTSVSAQVLSDTSVRVSWSVGAGDTPTGFTIAYNVLGVRSWKYSHPTSSPDTISGLNPGTTYEFRVLARTSSSNSGYTSPVRATTTGVGLSVPNHPQTVGGRVIDHDSIRVDWLPPSGGGAVATFSIRYRVSGTSAWTNITGISSTGSSYQIDGLTPSTTYQVQMRSGNSAGFSSWFPFTPVALTTESASSSEPGIPTSVMVTVLNHDSIRVTWGVPSSGGPVENYEVEYKRTADLVWTDAGVQTSPYTNNSLNSATAYQFRVRSTGLGGESDWVVVSGTTLSDTWIEIPSISSSSSSRDVNNLQPSTTYEFQIQSISSAGTSSWAPATPVTATTGIGVPNNPRNISVSAISHLAIEVTWQSPVGGGTVSSYNVRYRVNGTLSWNTISGITGTIRQISSLNSDTTYQVQVQSVNSSGTSSWNPGVPILVTTNPPIAILPGLPRNVSTSHVDHDRIIVRWTSPNTGGMVDNYVIRYRESGTSSWLTISNIGSALTSFTISNLDPNTTYETEIRSQNTGGFSNWVSGGSATTTVQSIIPVRPATVGLQIITSETKEPRISSPVDMYVVVRNLSGVPINNFRFQAENYSWSSLGGPETALVKVAGTHSALRYCLNMLRFPVEIYDSHLTLVWWGFVNKVILQDDATRITRSLQSYANSIGAFYTDADGKERFRGFVKSDVTEKYSPYGEKQILVDVNESIKNSIEDSEMLDILEHFENIPPTMETSRGDTLGANLECVGWGHTLQWQHTPYQDRGRYGEQLGYPLENVSRYASIIYSPQTQFNEGRLSQYADYRLSNRNWNDSSSTDHYLSHVIFPMTHLPPVTGRGAVTTYGGVRVELHRSTGANPLNDDQINAPTSILDNGIFIDRESITESVSPNTTGITPVTFRWNTANVLLPPNGWFFTLRSAGNRLSIPLNRYCFWYRNNAAEPRPNRYLWYQVKGTTERWGDWRAWREQTIANYNIPNWIQIPFEFYTRFGASALIEHIISNHSIIKNSLFAHPPATDEKFAAYLNGRETMATAIKNMCSVDDLFYTITPDKTLHLYEVPSDPNESTIVMKNDGTLSVRPIGNLANIVGKWVYDSSTQSVRGICVSARYEVRTGAYDLGFRGAPSLIDISTRVFQ